MVWVSMASMEAMRLLEVGIRVVGDAVGAGDGWVGVQAARKRQPAANKPGDRYTMGLISLKDIVDVLPVTVVEIRSYQVSG